MLIATEKMLSRPVSVPQPVNLAGIPVIPFESYDQALACIDHTLESGQKTFWVAINPQKCYRAWRERDLLSVLNRANAGICDGIGVSVAAMILHGRRIKRCTGCDLFFKVLPHAERKGWRIFMLGASAESNARARARLLEMHPNLKIVGSQDGFFQDSQAVVEKINRSDADLLFVAMGSPKQEYWISRYRPEINAPFCMGVGGSFDVASGMIRRAPKFFRATGTEWLFQLMTEPHKRLRRQLVYVPFMLRVLREKLLGSSEPESMEEELESARQSYGVLAAWCGDIRKTYVGEYAVGCIRRSSSFGRGLQGGLAESYLWGEAVDDQKQLAGAGVSGQKRESSIRFHLIAKSQEWIDGVADSRPAPHYNHPTARRVCFSIMSGQGH